MDSIISAAASSQSFVMGPESSIPEPPTMPSRPRSPGPCLIHQGASGIWQHVSLVCCCPATLRGQRWELGGGIQHYQKQTAGVHQQPTLWAYTQQPHRTHASSPNDTLRPASKGNPSMIQTRVQQSCTPGTRGISRQLCHHALHSRKQAPESWNQFSTSALPCL